MSEANVIRTIKRIENFEKKYLLMAGNVADIMEEENLTQSEARKVLSILKEQGVQFPRGSMGFLKEQVKMRRKK
jgi:hypothetical protein